MRKPRATGFLVHVDRYSSTTALARLRGGAGPVDFVQPAEKFPRDFLQDRKPSRPLAEVDPKI
jgi:hypothetical protein